MSEREQEEFELLLRQTKPARLPEDFAARLLAAEPRPETSTEPAPLVSPIPEILRAARQCLRWLVPAAAVALAVMIAWSGSRMPVRQSAGSGSRTGINAAPPQLKADDVKIDQRLVSSYDAVARLPDGVPVRVRYESWMDKIVLSDKSSGLVVENSRPRVEVVPVGFETY